MFEESEHDALKRLTSLVKEHDPDVIEGHDLFRVHLPLLVARAKESENETRLGAQRWILTFARPSRLQIAEKTIDYSKIRSRRPPFRRYFFARAFYDVGMRSLAGFRTIRCRPAF